MLALMVHAETLLEAQFATLANCAEGSTVTEVRARKTWVGADKSRPPVFRL